MADAYIDADAGSNGSGTEGSPYDSWDNMITDVTTDLVAATEGLNVYIKGTLTSGDGGGAEATLDAFTQDATYYVHLQAWPGFEGDGTAANTPGFQWQPAEFAFVCGFDNGEFARVTGLKTIATGTGNRRGLDVDDNMTLSQCIIQANDYPIRTKTDTTFNNCLIIANEATSTAYANGTFIDGCVFNFCTLINLTAGGNGFETRAYGSWTLKNCVTYGSATTEYNDAGGFTASSTNNAGETAEASQPTNIQNNYVELSSDPFTNFPGGDYSVPGGSALIAGTPVSGITTDIAGNARDGTTPTIGAFEVVSAGDTTAPTYGTSPAEDSVSTTSITVDATASDETDSTVDHYAVVVADGATAPSAAQVVAGNDSTDSAATASGSDLAVSNGAEGSITLTGLSAGTAYDVYYVVTDQSDNATTATLINSTTDITAPTFTDGPNVDKRTDVLAIVSATSTVA